MKVLHINSYYGAGKFFKNLCESQIEKNIDIDVFLPTPKLFDNNFDYGSYTTISKNHNKYDRIIFHLKHLKIFKDVKKVYNLSDFELLHAHSLFSNGYIAMKINKEYNIPYVVTVRSADVNPFFQKAFYLRGVGLKILKNAAKVTFLSKAYRDLVIFKYVPKNLQKEILAKSYIVPNGVDKFWLNQLKAAKVLKDNKSLKLIQVGDINQNKNILATVAAVNILKSKGYQIKLSVVGKVVDKNVFKQIKDLNFIDYLGYLSKADLEKAYSESDIFVLPSVKETFGLVYAEAMSQGLPIIYSQGQGFDQQFQDGLVGFSVDNKDPKDIANKIVEVVNNYNEISKACVSKVNKFNWDKVSETYISIYHKVLGKEKF